MKSSSYAAAAAVLFAVTLSACSGSTSTSTSTSTDTTTTSTSADTSASSAADSSATSSSTDNSASSSSDNSASGAGVNGVAVYPGATESAGPKAMGTPPPGAKVFETTDTPDKVKTWYLGNVTGLKQQGAASDAGTFLMTADKKTVVGIVADKASGKTYIAIIPSSAFK
ncbi:MAG: hypothetical protein JO199_08585 [Candidatus Eremiobacteraeota bacterium]|nr:hypothetical protein [Candidatus Eremiobacteraeota bacterium]